MELITKQKRAFQGILSGLKYAKYGNKRIRFLTLTSSELWLNSIESGNGVLNEDFKTLKKRIERYTPYKLFKDGYMTKNNIIKKYGREQLNKKLNFEYFKVETSEGNGVLHILYRGQYLPYNFIVDNWQDIHNSWDIHIMEVDLNRAKDTSAYIVSQYIGNQQSAYVRSSQSWNWVFRGYKQLWYKMKQDYPYQKKYIELWDKILINKAKNYFIKQTQLDCG